MSDQPRDPFTADPTPEAIFKRAYEYARVLTLKPMGLLGHTQADGDAVAWMVKEAARDEWKQIGFNCAIDAVLTHLLQEGGHEKAINSIVQKVHAEALYEVVRARVKP